MAAEKTTILCVGWGFGNMMTPLYIALSHSGKVETIPGAPMKGTEH